MWAVVAEVKFCGLTRPLDAEEAARIGAGYLGVIFAGGPRNLSIESARGVLEAAPRTAKRVGVFGSATAEEIGTIADAVGLDVVQLHADPGLELIRAASRRTRRPVWAALRIRGAVIPPHAGRLFSVAEAVVLDARVDHGLGGTGVTLPWRDIAAALAPLRGPAKLVLAGGLTPANVADAIAALDPDVVDVSSGVESAPGIKDHQLMRAFVGAARSNPRAA